MVLSRRDFLTLSGTFAIGAALAPDLAFASPIVISSLPTTITSSGSYVLASSHNLNMSSGAAIIVQATDVAIDLQGFTISNLTAGVATVAVGVYSTYASRVTVKNGTLEGFHSGVALHGQSSSGNIVEDLTLNDCTASAIMISGVSSIVRRNVINSSLRSTAFCSATSNTGILGIALANAARSRITDNSVTFTNNGASDFAVAVYAGTNCDEMIFLDNSITGADWGIIVDEAQLATGEMRDTTISGVTNKSEGGVDIDTL